MNRVPDSLDLKPHILTLPTSKGGKKSKPESDDESFVRDRYHEDVTEAIQMEEDEANARGGKKGKGRKKYRQASKDR